MVEILPSLTTFRHLVPGDIPNLLTLFHDGVVVYPHLAPSIRENILFII